MAHQAHNIPWHVFGSNLKLRSRIPCADDAAGLHFRFRPTQGEELTYFLGALKQNIFEHANSERQKYPETYQAPEQNEIVLSDRVARKITPATRQWRSENQDTFGEVDENPGTDLCQHSKPKGAECRCALPYAKRQMAAFLCRYRPSDCFKFFATNKDGFFGLEVFKTLLILGEMDALLRICSHPDVTLASWWKAVLCPCYLAQLGPDCVEYALDAYIGLNIFLSSFQESWAPNCPIEKNYRLTRIYQRMVFRITGTRAGSGSDLATYPHRQFFGIKAGQFKSHCKFKHPMTTKRKDLYSGTDQPYGRISYEEFLESQATVGFLPSVSDVPYVRWMLCEKGLPGEISQLILDEASYRPQRRLIVPHDPFHSDNRDELAKYLKFCWQILVRSEVVARAAGMDLEWNVLIVESIDRLFGCPCRKISQWDFDNGPSNDSIRFK